MVLTCVFSVLRLSSAGQVGPHSSFMSNPNAPERKDADALGLGLFGEPWQAWNQIYDINTFSVFFVTTAFLGLLDKGSKDVEGYLASVINVTSISGVIKLSQDHVSTLPRLMHELSEPTSIMKSSHITAERRRLAISPRCLQRNSWSKVFPSESMLLPLVYMLRK